MNGDAYFWTLSALLQGFAALMALAGMLAVFRLRILSDHTYVIVRDGREHRRIQGNLREDLMGLPETAEAYVDQLTKHINGWLSTEIERFEAKKKAKVPEALPRDELQLAEP